MNNQLIETNLNNNQTTPTTITTRVIIVTVITIILSAVLIWHFIPIKDPYIQQVLSFEGNLERGEAIFQFNCAGCHGIDAKGNVGPNLLAVSKHKSQGEIIKQVVSGKTPPMPKFQPSAEDMADLLSYLQKLS